MASDSESLGFAGAVAAAPDVDILSIQMMGTEKGQILGGNKDILHSSAAQIEWDSTVATSILNRFFVFVNGEYAGAFEGSRGVIDVGEEDRFFVEVLLGNVRSKPADMAANLTGFAGDKALVAFTRPCFDESLLEAPLGFQGGIAP